MWWHGLDGSDSVLGPVKGCCVHGNEPSGSCATGGFSRRAQLRGVSYGVTPHTRHSLRIKTYS
jgi:hypothetical protein